jgi:hypothetical protein
MSCNLLELTSSFVYFPFSPLPFLKNLLSPRDRFVSISLSESALSCRKLGKPVDGRFSFFSLHFRSLSFTHWFSFTRKFFQFFLFTKCQKKFKNFIDFNLFQNFSVIQKTNFMSCNLLELTSSFVYFSFSPLPFLKNFFVRVSTILLKTW